MLTLTLLGPVSLRAPDGREIEPVLRQPKRLALLVYLALSRPRPPRWHRRDALLGLFWPDLDQTHARAALRRALYFLRRELGEEVIQNRGDEEVGLAAGALACDVVELEDHLARGATAEALALYQGDLLESFFVAGAPAVEAWISRERQRVRTEAARAALALAAEPSPPADAERWARLAHELAPHDEAAVAALLEALARRGDRAAIRQTWEAFTSRLQGELGLAPSAGLLDRLARLEQPAPVAARSVTRGVETPVAMDRVLVLPFTVRPEGALEYLGEGMVDLLSARLDGAGIYRVVEPRSALASARALPGEPTAGDAAAAARRVGAGLVLQGAVVGAGHRIQVTAQLTDLDGTVHRSVESRAETEAEIFSLVDDLALRLLVPDHAGNGGLGLASFTTDSLPALKSWLSGERAFRLARYLDATAAFGRAAALDPTFALAHYRLASSLAAGALLEPAREASRRALEARSRLGHHDRLLVEAQHEWLKGASAEAERRYAAIVTAYPDSQEAWFLLGMVQVHSGPYRGRSIAAAGPALERAHRLDPRHLGTVLQLLRLAALERRGDDVSRLSEAALALDPGRDVEAGVRALLAFTAGGPRDQDDAAERVAAASGLAIGRAFSDVALYTEDPARIERFGARLFAAARSEEFRAYGHLVMAHLALARGRLVEAFDRVREAARFEPAWALEVKGLFASLPLFPVPRAVQEETLAELAAWRPEEARPSFTAPLALHHELHGHLRLYLIGLLSLRLADHPGADEASERLEELPVSPAAMAAVTHLVRTLHADRRRAAGASADALAALEMPAADVWFQHAVASPFYAGAYERFLRAELLAEQGRPVEALAWWDAIAERSPFELPFRAPALTRQQEVWTSLGDRDRAARCAARAAVLWGTGPRW